MSQWCFLGKKSMTILEDEQCDITVSSIWGRFWGGERRGVGKLYCALCHISSWTSGFFFFFLRERSLQRTWLYVWLRTETSVPSVLVVQTYTEVNTVSDEHSAEIAGPQISGLVRLLWLDAEYGRDHPVSKQTVFPRRNFWLQKVTGSQTPPHGYWPFQGLWLLYEPTLLT